MLRVEAAYTEAGENFSLAATLDWSGPAPIEIQASGNGTFSSGVLDTDTGQLIIDVADIPVSYTHLTLPTTPYV